MFAVGLLMRPIGDRMLGRYADRFGRRAALNLSVTVMAAVSLLIAATPGCQTIGIAAPVLPVLERLLRGLSLGGEYATSATYLSEVASPGKRGFCWRIPFLIGAGGALLIMWLRRSMDESEQFQAESDHQARGLLRVLLRYPRECLIVCGLDPDSGARCRPAYALTVAIFGGTAETIVLALKKANHESLYFRYVAICIAISLTIYSFMRETSKDSAIEAQADANAEVAVR